MEMDHADTPPSWAKNLVPPATLSSPTSDPEFIQTRLRDSANVVGAAASMTIQAPLVGDYWLLDRIVAICDGGGTMTGLALFDGNPASDQNVVAVTPLSAAINALSLPLFPYVQVAPGESITIIASGITVATHVNFGLWYRDRSMPLPAPKHMREFQTLPVPPSGPMGTEPDPDSEVIEAQIPKLTPGQVDQRDIIPLSVDAGDDPDSTYR